MKKGFLYTEENLSQISFPLGGIGSGCIGLSGNGQLSDWEIRNRPNKNSFNNYSGFFIKAEKDGKLCSMKVMNGDYAPPYQGRVYWEDLGGNVGFGFGPNERTFAGFSHFKDCTFRGEFPIAELEMQDDTFPGIVKMKAFNPFIPLNDKDSSIPAAFFDIELTNHTDCELEYSIALAAGSVFTYQDADNTAGKREDADGNRMTYVTLGTDTMEKSDTGYGDITIATDYKDTSYQSYWYRGGWYDNIEMFLSDFISFPRFQERIYQKGNQENKKDMGTLAVHMKIGAGKKDHARFLITWNFPNRKNTWNLKAPQTTWKNYYASLFENSYASAWYGLQNWERLEKQTRQFHDCLFSSDMPQEFVEAVSANLSVLKSPTCLRLEDGTFYGFEGCKETEGCCEGSCTHVWNYAYALPFLFPNLERSMRDADFLWNQREDGRMSFRLMLPLGSPRKDARACVDGQMGGIIKTYRDWRICGDLEWLKKNWKAVKASLTYAWAESNEDQWDPKKTGVISGRQHNTLDMELYGPNSWLNGFYLAALKAAKRMAKALGENDFAQMCRDSFQKGKEYTDSELFNGEYYIQKVDLHDKSVLEPYQNRNDPVMEKYWNGERGELKYQIASGCMIDQVMPQWHANLVGLGEIYDREQTKKALHALYERNFKCMRDVQNTWRIFSLNDEEGLLICTWSDGEKPAIPLTYNTETMTGLEYQAAVHMIQEGMLLEGARIIKAIRNRYDGEKRNPRNELECGSNYARSMASYSILLAYSGFTYDAVEKCVAFHPVVNLGKFFFCCHTGWGMVQKKVDGWEMQLVYGKLEILKLWETQVLKQIVVENTNISFEQSQKDVLFEKTVLLRTGETMSVLYEDSF